MLEIFFIALLNSPIYKMCNTQQTTTSNFSSIGGDIVDPRKGSHTSISSTCYKQVRYVWTLSSHFPTLTPSIDDPARVFIPESPLRAGPKQPTVFRHNMYHSPIRNSNTSHSEAPLILSLTRRQTTLRRQTKSLTTPHTLAQPPHFPHLLLTTYSTAQSPLQ